VNPLESGGHFAAVHFADQACQETVSVVENVRIARDTYRLRMQAPAVATRIAPGQFIMLRLAGYDDPLLGRPLALYDTVLDDKGLDENTLASEPEDGRAPWGLDVVYLVQGKLTTRLATFQPGQKLEIWGPLGNGFAPATREHLVMVAGGIGQTPFAALAQWTLGKRRYGGRANGGQAARRVTLCYGARSADYLAGVDDFRRLGIEVLLSTDDGTLGHHGLVTDLLERVLADSPNCQVAACGPEPMLAAVSRLTLERGIPCEVSLETPMACGIGICFSCVTRVKVDAGDWDYRRTCVEGPVFDASHLAW
jgi:dihydroorotate dehydrogenase electron transfer subunit